MHLELYGTCEDANNVVSVERFSRLDGIQVLVTFANGYSASVVKNCHSHGVEMAVIHGDRIVYDTPVTDDVLGYLTQDELIQSLNMVAELPPRTEW